MRFYAIWMFLILVPNLVAEESPYLERETKQFNFYPGGKVEIAAGASGNVKIIGWQNASVRMEAEKIVDHLPPEQAKKIIEQNPIKARWNQTTALFQTSGSLTINLTIYVPQEKTDINALIHQGDFSVDTVNGWIEATIIQGGIYAKSLSGYFSAMTQRGDIQAEMSGRQWQGAAFAARTQLGSAGLLLPSDYSSVLQLETRNGKITIDYPPKMVNDEPTPLEILIRKNSQSVNGAVGGGGAPIKLATDSGDVKLSKKPESSEDSPALRQNKFAEPLRK
jgi:DUF4097 and DUF4098 domain-containing protein YvlB